MSRANLPWFTFEYPSKPTEVGGFLALDYGTFDIPNPPDAQDRVVLLFDGSNEYEINCQSVPDQRDALNAACDQALRTLKKT